MASAEYTPPPLHADAVQAASKDMAIKAARWRLERRLSIAAQFIAQAVGQRPQLLIANVRHAEGPGVIRPTLIDDALLLADELIDAAILTTEEAM